MKIAKCQGCGERKSIKAKGLCGACYIRLLRYGSTDYRERPRKGEHLCSKCERDPVHAKGLCKTCYNKMRLRVLGHGECKECGENRKLVAKGLCGKCYAVELEKEKSAICEACGKFKPIKAKNLCRRCHARYVRNGHTDYIRPVKGAKLCSKCGRHPVHAKDMCKGCYSSALRKENPERYLEYDLQIHSGISLEEYYGMLERQNGGCAICGRKETIKKNGKPMRLSIDHDHETGRIRGLLCSGCNKGIGHLQDSPDILTKAIDYLN